MLAVTIAYGQRNVGDTFNTFMNGGHQTVAKFKVTSVNPKTVTLVEYIGDNGVVQRDVNIPQTVVGYTITAIGRRAFFHKEITSVTIPNTVISIGDYAFAVNRLTTIIIPSNVVNIGDWAFWYNQWLTSVVALPAVPPLLNTRSHPFAGQRINMNLIIPRGKRQAYLDNGWTGFNHMGQAHGVGDTLSHDDIEYEVTAINPDRMLKITNYTGQGGDLTIQPTINYLNTNYLVGTVIRIGEGAFISSQLTHVNIPRNVISIGNWAFRHNSLSSVTIPETTSSIGKWAFANNNLTEVTIPGKVAYIGNNAFQHNNLNKIAVKAATPPIIKKNTFKNRHLIDLVVPAGKIQDYLAKGWTGFKSISEIDVGGTFNTFMNGGHQTVAKFKVTSVNPKTVTVVEYIGDSHNGVLQKDVNIPQTVVGYTITAIGGEAFKEKGLTHVTIPNTVTSIGDRAFWNNQLTSVTIPNSVTSIGLATFAENQLTSVDIPDSVTSIGLQAFAINQLNHVTIPNGVTSIGLQAFANNNLTQVTIPNSVTSIEEHAFVNNQLITTVTAQGGATIPNIDADAFVNVSRNHIDLVVPKGKRQDYVNNGWTGFKSITEEVEDGDFFTVDNLRYQVVSVASHKVNVTGRANGSTDTNITIPRVVRVTAKDFKVTGTSGGAFQNNNLTSVTFESPSNITRIANDTFEDNQLESVTIPNSVESIGNWAFAVNQLTNIRALGNIPPTFDNNTFQNRNQIDVVVPKGKRQDYLDNGWTGFKSITEGVLLSIEGAPSEITNLTPFDITFQFATDVTGFTVDDISLTNATLSDFTGNGSTYTVKVTPTICNAAIQITVPENVAEYAPNFPNLAASKTVTVNVTPETPTLSSNSPICSGETAIFTITGNPGDMVTYSGASNGTATIEADGTVEVTVNAASTDVTLNLTEVTNGNCSVSLTQTATVTVQDATLTAIAQNAITLELDANGQATITDQQIDNGSYNSCSNHAISLSLNRTDFSCNDINAPVPVTLTVTSGNSLPANAATAVTVVDRIAPTVITKNHTIQLDAGGQAIITTNAIDNGSFDNCEIEQMTLSQEVFNNTGTFTVTLTVTDKSGNEHSATAQVTVEPLLSQTGDEFTESNLKYKIMSVNPYTVAVTGMNGTNISGQGGDLDIPQTVNYQGADYTVTVIGHEAFKNKGLDQVTIPNTVTNIIGDSFSHNNLISLVIPGSVTSIGAHAFRDNNLTEVTILDGVTNIGNYVFTNNPITTVTAEGVVTVPTVTDKTFSNRNQIDVVIPKGKRQDYDTAGWTGFKSIGDVEIFTQNDIHYRITSKNPNTVTVTDYNALQEAQDVVIPQTVNYQGVDYTVNSIGNNAFRNNQLTSVTIPNSVTSIRDNAFFNSQLTSVEIPDSVTSIGNSAFRSNQLTDITIPDNLTSISNFAFRGNQLSSLSLGSGVNTIGYGAFRFNNLTEVTIPDQVASIGGEAFANNPITKVTAQGATTVPTIVTNNTFSNRNTIDVFVPTDKRQEYLNNGWTGFKSIQEEVSLSIDDNNALKNFKIYPNPARDNINIQLNNDQELKQVNIYNVSGRRLYTGSTFHIDTSRLSSGLYLLEVTTKTGARAVKRVIVE